MSAPPGFSPARPPNERDIVQQIAGQPNFLGVLTSTGAVAVNNSTTAFPFNATALNPPMFRGTLAGKTLLVQPTAAGLILPGESAVVNLVQQATAPNPPLAIPGVLLGINERVELTLGPSTPFLQFVAVTGTASLLVWEMT